MKGVAALPTILIITAIIFEIGVIIALSSYYINSSLYLSRANSAALFAAEAGINDAIARIARDRTFDASDSYTLPISAGISADVVIERQTSTTTITATGRSGTVVKKIRAIVNINPSDFKTTLESWEEI